MQRRQEKKLKRSLSRQKVLSKGATIAEKLRNGESENSGKPGAYPYLKQQDQHGNLNLNLGHSNAARLRKAVIRAQTINKNTMLKSCANAASVDQQCCNTGMKCLLKESKNSPSAKEVVNTLGEAKQKAQECKKAEIKAKCDQFHCCNTP